MAQLLTSKDILKRYSKMEGTPNIENVNTVFVIERNPQRIYLEMSEGVWQGYTRWMKEDLDKREESLDGEELGLNYHESRELYMDYIMGRRKSPILKGDELFMYWNEPPFGPYIKITFKEVKNEI